MIEMYGFLVGFGLLCSFSGIGVVIFGDLDVDIMGCGL